MRFAGYLLVALALPAIAQQGCDQQAGRLLDLLGVHDARHRILEENLATYLFNLREPVPEESLQSLEAFRAWLGQKEIEYRRRRTFGSNELGRWPSKFYLSLDRPYTDVEAGRHYHQMLRAFQGQCQTLSAARPAYPRQFFAFGGLVHGRFGLHSDLDFFFNDPAGVRGSKPFVVRGLCRGLAFDQASFDERKSRYLEGRQDVMLGGPVYDLGSVRPWAKLHSMVMARLSARGLDIHDDDNWVVKRRAFPPRKFEDPASDQERDRSI